MGVSLRGGGRDVLGVEQLSPFQQDVGNADALVQFQTGGKVAPNPKLLRNDLLAADRIRTSRRQHPTQHRHADGSFGLLGNEAAGAQP